MGAGVARGGSPGGQEGSAEEAAHLVGEGEELATVAVVARTPG